MTQTTLIPLTRGYSAVVDEADAEKVLSMGKWHAVVARDVIFYAARNRRVSPTKFTMMKLHTFLTGYDLTDHINGDGLDNRRSNLRLATNAQNGQNRRRNSNNTSGYRGVTWNKTNRNWTAQCMSHGQHYYLGSFSDPVEAARAVDAAKVEMHGEYARLNFPPIYDEGGSAG